MVNKTDCSSIIYEKLESRMKDFRRAVKTYEKLGRVVDRDKQEYNDITDWLNNYALGFDDDIKYRAKRLELSYGGPQDYFLFFEDGTIEYHYLDWYDGASTDLSGDDYEVMQQIATELGIYE